MEEGHISMEILSRFLTEQSRVLGRDHEPSTRSMSFLIGGKILLNGVET
jgi:hypothetical protein